MNGLLGCQSRDGLLVKEDLKERDEVKEGEGPGRRAGI